MDRQRHDAHLGYNRPAPDRQAVQKEKGDIKPVHTTENAALSLPSHKDELRETEAIGREGRTVSAVRPFRFAQGSVNLNNLLRAVQLSVHATPEQVTDIIVKVTPGSVRED